MDNRRSLDIHRLPIEIVRELVNALVKSALDLGLVVTLSDKQSLYEQYDFAVEALMRYMIERNITQL